MITSETLQIVLAVDGEQQARSAIDGTAKSITNLDRVAGVASKTFNAWKGLLVGAVVAGTTVAIKRNLDFADSIGKTAQRIGVSTEALSEYAFVAKRSGVELTTLSTAWQRQARRISEAAQGTGVAKAALEELQIPIRELENLAPDEQFEKLSAAMLKLPTQADRIRVAMKLWDTEGVKLVQTMAEGTEGIDAMRAKARELGQSLSTEQTQAAAQFNDALTDMGAAFDGVLTQIVLLVAEPATALLNFLADIIGYAVKVVEYFVAMKDAIFGVRSELVSLKNHNVDFEKEEQNLNDLRRALEGTSDPAERASLATSIAALETVLSKLERPAKEATSALNALAGEGGGVTGSGGLPAVTKEVKELNTELDTFAKKSLTFAAASLDETTVAVNRYGEAIKQEVVGAEQAAEAIKKETAAHNEAATAAAAHTSAVEGLLGVVGALGLSFDLGGGATLSTGVLAQLAPLLSGGISPLMAAGLGGGIGGGAFGGAGGILGGAAGGYAGAVGLPALLAPLLLSGGPPTAGVAALLTALPAIGGAVGGLLGGGLGSKIFGKDEPNPRIYVETLELAELGDVRGSSGNLGSRGTFALSDFGGVAVGGLDGQGRPNIQAAQTIAALDNAIAGILDPEQLAAAIAAAQSHAEDTKAGSFDLGTTIVQRTDAIFEAIGGELEALYLALDPTAETITEVVIALDALQGMGDNARTVATSWDAANDSFLAGIASLEAISTYMDITDPIGKIGDDLDELSRGPLARMSAAADEVTRLAAAYDGSVHSTQELAAAVSDLAAAEVQALAAIRGARSAVNDSTGSSLRSIDRMGLSGSALYDFEITRANELKNLLPTLTDPDAIASTVREINALGVSALSALGPSNSQFGARREDVKQLISGTSEYASDQLSKKEQLIADAHKTAAEESKVALSTAATDLKAAAAELDAAAKRVARPPDVTIYVGDGGEITG